MKVVALYPIGNNEYDYLKLSLQSIENVVDEIVVLIDYPFRDSKKKSLIKLLNDFDAKIYFQDKNKIRKSTVDRDFLFHLGRKHGGTHFVCIDCDEILSNSFAQQSNKIFKEMKIGEKIMMRWLSAWSNPFLFRTDKKSIWSNMWKDFIVCDDLKQSYNSDSGYHEPRTICKNDKLKYLNINNGCVIHLQFIDQESFKLKQIYYSIHDYLNKKVNISEINRKYLYSFIDNFPKLSKLPNNCVNHLNPNDLNNVINLNYSFFWKKKILRILNKMDIKKIQNLNIWNNEFTKLVYKKKTNMLPRISVFEILKLFLFYVKSSILIIIK
jgi:hypothetical protein